MVRDVREQLRGRWSWKGRSPPWKGDGVERGVGREGGVEREVGGWKKWSRRLKSGEKVQICSKVEGEMGVRKGWYGLKTLKAIK